MVSIPVSPRVLLIEGDVHLGGGMVALLAENGHQVAWVQSVAQARSAIEGATVDLVLLDLGRPDGDGSDLCALLRSRHPQVVMMVVTARSSEADAVRVLDEGADDVVLGPFAG
ncbi:hypothetical protein GCM10022223_33610 [Kineosporia mesophila]|uniref:Response regulatory domain-containing protein n=1 Tax=Kineosporia mesophila TaxID=566012 RepID=A0ABP6ZNS5_9ACTN|nr:response regulator [Kineosporia mesophila]MCD5353654.1 response regulator [Kineosporia mesophila]